ncbi:MAG: DoxX family protein [Solirubrobacterales bacterium]|nr:DoxX family protein [Solirubrobacterales bacterium]
MRILRQLVGPFYILAGVMHFITPSTYRKIMPSWVPAHDAMIYATGVTEAVGGAGMLSAARRRPAGLLLIATMIGVVPVHVDMALHPDDYPRVPGGTPALWARIPFQGVFITWILDAMRRERA